jgi:hypothetical protein
MIKAETLPYTAMVDGLGVVHIYRNENGRIAVDINGKIAWTYMVGLEQTLWYVNEDIRRWRYVNSFSKPCGEAL